MKTIYSLAAAAALVALAGAHAAFAEPAGVTTPVKPAAKGHPLNAIYSGYKWASAETQAMEDDEFANPAGPWMEIGEREWSKVDGEAGKSCNDCHKGVSSMKGVATKFPVYFEPWKKMMSLEQRINFCRETNMKAKPYKWEGDEMLGMMIHVKAQSRGMPVSVAVDGPAKPFFDKGKEYYYARRGQLDMSCAHCHEKNFGQQIRAEVLSQGQSNGFPTYRLKWQKPGSLHRRFKGCNEQVRAKGQGRGADDYVNLELYLAWRGQGLDVETPAVRR
ncbi:MAG: sulfur oxidation c-type cytochrome SoxA [Hyphomicrobiaceae bacterium]